MATVEASLTYTKFRTEGPIQIGIGNELSRKFLSVIMASWCVGDIVINSWGSNAEIEMFASLSIIFFCHNTHNMLDIIYMFSQMQVTILNKNKMKN